MPMTICSNVFSASGKDVYDSYFVFDADNYVDPDFVKEMNATFDSVFAALTSYRIPRTSVPTGSQLVTAYGSCGRPVS